MPLETLNCYHTMLKQSFNITVTVLTLLFYFAEYIKFHTFRQQRQSIAYTIVDNFNLIKI